MKIQQLGIIKMTTGSGHPCPQADHPKRIAKSIRVRSKLVGEQSLDKRSKLPPFEDDAK